MNMAKPPHDPLFRRKQLIFLLTFCIMYPVMLAFLLHTFSPTFRSWEQLDSVLVISVVAVILCMESLATNSLALYQCYFANVSFLLRVINGFDILVLYLVANLLIVPCFGWEVNATQLRVCATRSRQPLPRHHAQKQKLVEEEARITKLLLNLLPETIVRKLKEDPQTTIADFFDNVTREVLYKIEIIGDAYFVVGGCPIVTAYNALAVVTAATDMFAVLPLLRRNCGVPDLNIRIGVHSGPVLAGVVGSKDPRYHLFGEMVSIAHFLESSGVPGRIHISESTWASMNKETPGHGFKVEYHTLLSISGSSKKLRTYFVL
ncbi:hypothetical protein PF001_g9502 [Phytophthora fragariae]|uniref:Guanylate cyclase domain-containing protein n=1 Tax=Phytophthora fragariae TaxID=53985 RepID=A0A6A3U2U8_9STRA|nr:hypothetical protein PF006_g10796 [Phytophthora fragariae]KAE9311908.1 hypothetical protein PF001_g9502 [Phytophthora fragariae]